MDIKDINQDYEKLIDREIDIIGYVKTNRFNGTIGFIELTDGTSFKSIQVVYKKGETNAEKINSHREVNPYDEDPDEVADLIESEKEVIVEKLASIRTGDTIVVVGTVVRTPASVKQDFEIHANEITVVKKVDDDYPLQKKKHSLEFLRENAHLRPRTNLFQAVMRVRSEMAFAIHKFFQANNFIWVSSPIITSNDGEGAGETFTVTAHGKEFFDQPASLSVTGQLQAEAYAQAFKKVYTFGPTFRAENSHTSRHAAEFWMVEPEIANCNLETLIELARSMITYLIETYLKRCSDEIDFFVKWVDPNIRTKLTDILEKGFYKLEYQKAIEILKETVKRKPDTFEENNIFFGMDLASEHERFLCEKVIKGPVFIYNYPKNIKAFYMKQNDDGETVRAVDCLVPGIGELIGGSEREADYNKLVSRCEELGMKTESLQWYLDLRRFGYYRSSGFGLGFERLIMYLTGVDNIRDVIPFPRTPGSLKF